MLSVLFLFLASAFAKENFRVNNVGGVTLGQALATCFSSSVCTNADGCCHGHGVCTVSSGVGGLVASCVCDALPSECHGATNYNSTTNCGTLPATAVCCDGSDVDFQENGDCHFDSAHPERGAKGSLLRRVGDQSHYADGVGTLQPDNITSLANDMMTMGLDNTVTTTANMFGLGLLEVAIKDMVHYAYYDVSVSNYTFDNVTYPALKWQNNTGVNGTNYSIPKHHENTATSIIDLGPLYDYAPRLSGGVYLDINTALLYWNGTHHMSWEFQVALRYYARFHYYIARSIEEYLFGGQNSTYASVTRTSALGNWTTCKDTIYQQARRSTIRHAHALLEQNTLQLFLDNDLTHEGLYHAFFDQYFRKDQATGQTSLEPGQTWSVLPQASIRQNQEFAGDKVRGDFRHYSASGLDWLISMRSGSIDTTTSSLLQNSDCDEITPEDHNIAYDVLNLQNTRASKIGSKVHSQYSSELKRNLYMANELGLPAYATTVSYLTNANGTSSPPSVSDLTPTQQAGNVYHRAHQETNITRKFRNRTSSVVYGFLPAVLNDVLITDRTGHFARNLSTGVPTAANFHSKIFITPDDGTSFYTYCYKSGGACTSASTDAAVVIYATHPDINDNWLDIDGAPENQYYWRSPGALFSSPGFVGYPGPDSNGIPDYDVRRTNGNKLVPEVVNALWYRFDGLNSLACKQVGSDIRYLPNQVIDAYALNVAWDGDFDGLCYNSNYMDPGLSGTSPGCDRTSTNFYTYACQWNWPY